MSNRVESASMIPQSNGDRTKLNNGLVRIKVTVTYISPLLMNAMSMEKLLSIRNKDKSSRNVARPLPREEAESKLHVLSDGRVHLPVNAYYKTLINAGQFVRLDGKRQISTAQKTVLPGMLIVEDTVLPIFAPGKTTSATWEVDIQQGKNPNGNEAVCIIRPRFDEWEIRATIEVDQSQMSITMARELFEIAGKHIGFLEFTPQHKGTYGRFSVTKWKIVE